MSTLHAQLPKFSREQVEQMIFALEVYLRRGMLPSYGPASEDYEQPRPLTPEEIAVAESARELLTRAIAIHAVNSATSE